MRLIDADVISYITAPIAPIIRGQQEHYETIAFKEDIDKVPTVDAVPVEFIQQRIAQLNDAIEYEFNELGEYDGWALHAQSALEQLLQAWVAERKEE